MMKRNQCHSYGSHFYENSEVSLKEFNILQLKYNLFIYMVYLYFVCLFLLSVLHEHTHKQALSTK